MTQNAQVRAYPVRLVVVHWVTWKVAYADFMISMLAFFLAIVLALFSFVIFSVLFFAREWFDTE